jgi:hypothetical protein
MSNSASSSDLVQAINWLALAFRVPEDWEIVRHGVAYERGSLVFVDRVRQRLSVSWTSCSKVPDLDRLLSDFADRPLSSGERVLSQADCHGFRLLDCETGAGERIGHALYFDPRSHRLVELELPGAAEPGAAALTSALLGSFEFHEREQSGCVRAFGLHADVPSGFRICKSHVKPADVILELERSASPEERAAERVRIRRSGMARSWFDGNAERAIRHRNPESRFDEFEVASVGPHAAVTARVYTRGALLARALGRAVPRRITFWACPEQNAVFEMDAAVPRGSDPRALGFRVWCCAEHGAEHAHAG